MERERTQNAKKRRERAKKKRAETLATENIITEGGIENRH